MVKRLSSKKGSISQAAFKVRYLRRSRELWRKYLEDKPWIAQLYTRFLGLYPGMTIVDVGCGTGDFTRYLALLSPGRARMVGVDARAASIKAAEAETKKAGLSKGVVFKVGDVNKLPLENNYADLTCCRTLLMHLPDPLIAVKEMARITRRGGSVVAVEPGGMRTFHDHKDQKFTELALAVEKAYREGIKKLEGKDFAIGEKLPGIFQRAGLIGVRAEVQADAWVNSDPRRKLRDVRDEIKFEWQMFKENEKIERRYLLAGGLSQERVRSFVRQQERRVKQYLSSDDTLRNDTSTYGAGIFITIGDKPVSGSA